MPRIGGALCDAARELRGAGVDSARRDARLIMGAVLDQDVATIIGHPDRDLTAGQWARFRDLIARRRARRPLSQVLGRREFWGLEFRVNEHVLDPRPDSECLVEAVLERVRNRLAPIRVLDLGTGSGCLLLSLLRELPAATGLGIDLSGKALDVARANAGALGLAGRTEFRLGSWFAGVDGSFDVVISNPPYIRTADIDGLMPEVARHEPRMALDGGSDGLECYRQLGGDLSDFLNPAGLAALEIGAGQADEVAAILAAGGLAPAARRRDLQGHVRVLVFERKTA
jgi:release factor glutamine methyltransferase